jgi:hypothetical protein
MALPPTDIPPKAVQCQLVSGSPPALEPKISKPLCALSVLRGKKNLPALERRGRGR